MITIVIKMIKRNVPNQDNLNHISNDNNNRDKDIKENIDDKNEIK